MNDDLRVHATHRAALLKWVLRLGDAKSPETQKACRDRLWAGGGAVWLRAAAAALGDSTIRTMDGHPTITRAERQASRRRANDPEARNAWLRERRAEEAGRRASERQAIADGAGIAPPKATRKSVLAQGMAANSELANRSYIPPAEVGALAARLGAEGDLEKSRKRAERALQRDMDGASRYPSEHARDFPRYAALAALHGRIPVPPVGDPARPMYEAWIASVVDSHLNPFGRRDRDRPVPERLERHLGGLGLTPEVPERVAQAIADRVIRSAT